MHFLHVPDSVLYCTRSSRPGMGTSISLWVRYSTMFLPVQYQLRYLVLPLLTWKKLCTARSRYWIVLYCTRSTRTFRLQSASTEGSVLSGAFRCCTIRHSTVHHLQCGRSGTVRYQYQVFFATQDRVTSMVPGTGTGDTGKARVSHVEMFVA